MVARPGFLGGLRSGDAPERDAADGFAPNDLLDAQPVIRLGGPGASRPFAGFGGQPAVGSPPGFDPVWGTLGSPATAGGDGWLTEREPEPEGIVVYVEILGNGFQISGQLRIGNFDRLSDWINMQSGFIQVRDARQVHFGLAEAPQSEQARAVLWVRLDQVALIAERTSAQSSRPGAPVVQKQRRKVTIFTPGYSLQGSIHLHANGAMAQFLESPDLHFIPVTDLTVRLVSSSALVARFPFALVNREQLVTILEQNVAPAGEQSGLEGVAAEDEQLHRRQGAA
jgi:hypothetical protein